MHATTRVHMTVCIWLYGCVCSTCVGYRVGSIVRIILVIVYTFQHLASSRSIRSKALVQFVEPFTSLNLAHAAEALNTNVPGVQQELEPLIAQGSIDALIDSHNGVLYARRREQRAVTFREAMAAGVWCGVVWCGGFTGILHVCSQRRRMCGTQRRSCCGVV